MMEYKIVSTRFLMIALALCLLSSCDKESVVEQTESPSAGGRGRLAVETSIEGFRGDSSPASRATLNGLITSFAEGDMIGVTAVNSSGAVMVSCDNVPMTYTSGGKWTGDASDLGTGVTYIAYYPYKASMKGKKSLDEIKSSFPLGNDQSTEAKFLANDLLIATGKLATSGGSLSLTFTHAFSWLQVGASNSGKLKGRTVTYEYTLHGSGKYTITRNSDGAEITPYIKDNNTCMLMAKAGEGFKLKYNYTYNDAGTGKTSTYALATFSLTAPVAGKKKVSTLVRDLKLGDYFYRDKTIVPKEINSQFPATAAKGLFPDYKDCCGPVCLLGNTTYGSNGMVLSRSNIIWELTWEEAKAQADYYGGKALADGNVYQYSNTPPDGVSWILPDANTLVSLYNNYKSGGLRECMDKMGNNGYNNSYWCLRWSGPYHWASGETTFGEKDGVMIEYAPLLYIDYSDNASASVYAKGNGAYVRYFFGF